MIRDLERQTGLSAQEKAVTGARTTTMAVGGAYRYFVEPNSIDELRSLVQFLKEKNEKYRVLGGGSNIIVPDEGVNDWVIKLGKGLREITPIGSEVFRVGASTPLMVLSRELSDHGFSGLEFAGGIPASVGGAIRMNAGAHGGAMGDIVRKVTYIDPEGDLRERTQFAWSYRHSDFIDGSIVVSAEIQLTASDVSEVRERRAHFLAERKSRQPLTFPSSGSVFKNPASGDRAAGAILERAGLKGKKIGEAEISTLHANWIINPQKRASANDVEALISLCIEKAYVEEKEKLERELIYWGVSPEHT